MIQIENMELGNRTSEGILIRSPGGESHPNMILIRCRKGYLMCGYLNMDAAEKFGDAAVLVGGSSFAEVLANPVKGATTAARKAGVTDKMTGQQAAEVLNS